MATRTGPGAAWREARNAQARARLDKALPPVFPAAVLVHARARPLVPPLPRLAVESYWRHHPVRADRLARALAALSPVPDGWSWRLAAEPDDGRARSFRAPPAPFREAAHRAEPGICCLCGQPVYRFGWHRDLWGQGLNRRARWHGCCVAAWKLWNAPADQAKLLGRLQKRRCPATGGRLPRAREVDHRVPLHVVWRTKREEPWAGLLRYWGFPNLQAIAAEAHRAKTGAEATARARAAAAGAGVTADCP
ncbi:hypothetical protein [Lichenibacterium dinghuense]|uniref:hypothetical protein n=1 Tax=Lichenibacterium dinghuense TaxID=2895977 RepID=UPI001F40602A|nr:hypothetical protein [Lichenibacterium sp. 6Y81]